VRLSHWEKLVDLESKKEIKRCYTLNSIHLQPSPYDKMNVPIAMQVFTSYMVTF